MQGDIDVLEDEINKLTALKRQVNLGSSLGLNPKRSLCPRDDLPGDRLHLELAVTQLLTFTSLVTWSHHTF